MAHLKHLGQCGDDVNTCPSSFFCLTPLPCLAYMHYFIETKPGGNLCSVVSSLSKPSLYSQHLEMSAQGRKLGGQKMRGRRGLCPAPGMTCSLRCRTSPRPDAAKC